MAEIQTPRSSVNKPADRPAAIGFGFAVTNGRPRRAVRRDPELLTLILEFEAAESEEDRLDTLLAENHDDDEIEMAAMAAERRRQEGLEALGRALRARELAAGNKGFSIQYRERVYYPFLYRDGSSNPPVHHAAYRELVQLTEA